MDFENLLITKCVEHGGIETLIAKGITYDLFEQDENVEIWKFLSDHITKYKSAPNIETTRKEFPDYTWTTTSEPIEYISDQFIVSVKRREAVKKWKEVAEILDENDPKQIENIEEIILSKAKELSQVIPTSNVSKFSQMPQRVELYKARKAEGIQSGMLYGFTKLDEATLGIHRHQYVTVAGWTGIGKSTLGMIFAVNHYANGFIPLIISAEMDEEEIYRKLDSIAVGLKQQAIKNMTLPGKDLKRWEEFAERVVDAPSNIIVVDVDNPTAETIYAETLRWNPDVVIMDYIQLMEGPKKIYSRWERIDENSKALKRQAKSLRIPIYGLSQTNADGEDGAELSNIGGSKSIAHHSDVVFGLKQSQEDFDMNKMNITIKKNRMGPKDIVQSLYWDQRNSVFEEWTEKHAWKAIEKYQEEEV